MSNEEWKVGDDCVTRNGRCYVHATVVGLTASCVNVRTPHGLEAYYKRTARRVGHNYSEWRVERPSDGSRLWFARSGAHHKLRELIDVCVDSIDRISADQSDAVSAVLNDTIAKIAAIKGE